MEKPVIHFIFSCGFRCPAPDALKFNGLRMMSGPLDYIFVDLESAFKLITRKFDGLINDIVEFKKSENTLSLCYPKYSSEICHNFINFAQGPVMYMVNDKKNDHYFYNQMYLDDKIDCNLYKWDSICVFAHHNLYSSTNRETIIRRCERFNQIMDRWQSEVVLFHVTKIVTNIEESIQNIIRIKGLYDTITAYLVVIVCYDETVEKINKKSLIKDGIIFIFKPVEPYAVQAVKYGDDNSAYRYKYNEEIEEMRTYFNFELTSLDILNTVLN